MIEVARNNITNLFIPVACLAKHYKIEGFCMKILNSLKGYSHSGIAYIRYKYGLVGVTFFLDCDSPFKLSAF